MTTDEEIVREWNKIYPKQMDDDKAAIRLWRMAEERGYAQGLIYRQAIDEGCKEPEKCKDIHCPNHGSHDHPHILSTDEKKCSFCDYEFPKEEVERQRKEMGGKFRWDK